MMPRSLGLVNVHPPAENLDPVVVRFFCETDNGLSERDEFHNSASVYLPILSAASRPMPVSRHLPPPGFSK